MIDTILKSVLPLYPKLSNIYYVPIPMKVNNEYYIKVSIFFTQTDEKFIDCILTINLLDDERTELLTERFYTEKSIKFKREEINPEKDKVDHCAFKIEIPNMKTIHGLEVEIVNINNDIINSLHIKQKKKDELLTLVDRYLKDDFEGAISDIGNIGEYIAKETVKKIRKEPVENFKNAIDALVNYDITKTRINYNYIGCLLYPIYYARNQKSHPYPKIQFHKRLAEILLKNLSEIIYYLSTEEISL